MDLASGVAADTINKVIIFPLIQQINDVIHLDLKNQQLDRELRRMQLLLQEINNSFQNQQRRPPEYIRHHLAMTEDAISEARSLVDRSLRKRRSLEYCIFCRPRISTQIRELCSRIGQLFQELQTEFLIFANTQQIVSASTTASQPVMELLQPIQDGSFVGSGIEYAERQLQRWVTGAPHVLVIGVHGIAGIGKTSLLKTVYKFYKHSNVFDVMIWITVSSAYKIPQLQDRIAEALNLDLSKSSIDVRKMKLHTILKMKKFLLILDDLRRPLDVRELGVPFEADIGSKVVFSCRDEALMEEAQKSIIVKPLSRDEGWTLFERVAFKGGQVREELEEYAREIADECAGLPLSIIVVAAALSAKTSIDEWRTSLSHMRIEDTSFPNTHTSLDKLYRKLRWSYNDLLTTDPNLQNCFLYCAMYPEDVVIDVDILVRMWIAEGFIQSNEGTYSTDMALGNRYVKLLIDHGLFQNVSFEKQSMYDVNKPVNVWKSKYITVHDVIREIAIYIGEEVQNYLCLAGQQFEDFPHLQTQDCKRISLLSNQIEYLPADFHCRNLVSFILSENPLSKVPESFLVNLTSLRVLDLSNTHIASVPTSLSQLTLLEFLTLKNTLLSDLPEEICNLSGLQFLDLSFCRNLKSLPYTLGNLTKLQYLNLMGLPSLVIPLEISQITSLRRLELQTTYRENSEALKGLTNLTELAVTIISEAGEHEIAISSGTWLEMRHLSLRYESTGASEDLPQEMQKMNKLQSFQLLNYKGINRLKANLPNWICDFQELERLELIGCDQLTELPPLEKLPRLKFLKFKDCSRVKYLGIGSSSCADGFPMLQRLDLIDMFYLQGMVSLSSNVLIKGTLANLRVLKIKICPKLKTLPMGMENLPKLIALIGEDWWWNGLIWEDHYMKMYLHNLFRGI